MIEGRANGGHDGSMRFDTSQQMRLSQQMKLAPRMIQSMEILQMPVMALQERIEQELEANVALEQVEPTADDVEGASDSSAATEADDDRLAESLDRRELSVAEDGTNSRADWERLSVLESSYSDAYDNEYSSSKYRASPSGERDRKLDAMASIAARQESLAEQISHQWTFAEVEPEVAKAGEVLISFLDADGLLRTDFGTILEQHRDIPDLMLTEELLQRSLDQIQRVADPPGIGARTQQECFLLQIDELQSRDPGDYDVWEDVRLLIKDHYEDLLQNRLPRISETADMALDRINAAMELMRKLNLSPGRDLADEEVPPVIPDVIIEYDDELDEYTARLAGDVLPSLRVSDRYASMAKDRAQEKSTREFLTKSVRNAQWLIDSINQRKSTLLRVVNVVLARQREYFDQGSQYLKPLPMIEVADQLGVHVATVSRAVAEKWMQTPRGMVPLRKFFSGGTSTDSGRDMSWEAIKATLQEIVDAEDKTNPMSDEALSRVLKERGIEIARRTVVKYRQQLGIPPARRRRVFVEPTSED